MERKITFNKLEDRIMELLFRAESFAHWSHELYKSYNEQEASSQNAFITMHVNLYFAESLSCTHSLMYGDSKNEISINYLFNKYPNHLNITDQYKDRFNEIKNEYANMNLNKIRHKILAHKDIQRVGDPVTGFLNRITEQHILNLETILKDTSDYLYNVLPDPPANNYFISLYEPAFEFIKKAINNKQ